MGTPGRPGDLLLDEGLEQALGIEVRAGEDELRADHRGEVGVAPGVRVEHRDDREQRVAVGDAEAERRGGRDTERVQDRGAVRVDDAFAAARRSAREAHCSGGALVELRVLPLVGARRVEQRLVAVLDDDHVLDLRLVLELVEQRQQGLVDDDGLVVRVVGDVGEVARVQAEVERVQDEPGARDPEVRLEVLVVVPAQCGDPVAGLEAQLLQGDGELLGPPGHVRVRVAVEALVGEPRDDLLVAEERLRTPQDRRERQLVVVHHQALHSFLLGRSPRNRRISSSRVARAARRPGRAHGPGGARRPPGSARLSPPGTARGAARRSARSRPPRPPSRRERRRRHAWRRRA